MKLPKLPTGKWVGISLYGVLNWRYRPMYFSAHWMREGGTEWERVERVIRPSLFRKHRRTRMAGK